MSENMRKYIVIVSLCLSVFLMSCDNYLDLVPKGESVLNTTDDYLGLVESMTSEFPTDDFWYFSGDATWPYKNEIENYKYPLYLYVSSEIFLSEKNKRNGQKTTKINLCQS